jgi:hypothetical protein
MTAQNAQICLTNILSSTDPENNLSQLLSFLPTLPKPDLKLLLSSLKPVFSNSLYQSSVKLNVSLIFTSLMSRKIPSAIKFIHNKILSQLSSFIMFQPNCSGFELWIGSLQDKDTALFKTFILTLQNIETWAEVHGKDSNGRETGFLALYETLKKKEIEFPPSFFLRPWEPNANCLVKKDLHRIRKLCKEFVKSINFLNIDKTNHIKKIVNSYGKYLEKELESGKELKEKKKEELLETLEQVKSAKEMYNEWKKEGFEFKGRVKTMKIINVLVEDPFPKPAPLDDVLNEIERTLAENEFPVQAIKLVKRTSANKVLSKQENEIASLREQLENAEKLITEYRNAKEVIEDQCTNLTKENKAYSEKNSFLLIKTKELEEMLISSKLLHGITKSELQKATKEIDAITYQNEVLKNRIKELEDEYTVLEKQSLKHKSYIDSLENIQYLLLFSNEALKKEIEKSQQSDLSPLIQSINNEGDCPYLSYLPQKYLCTQSIRSLSNSESDSENLSSETLPQECFPSLNSDCSEPDSKSIDLILDVPIFI